MNQRTKYPFTWLTLFLVLLFAVLYFWTVSANAAEVQGTSVQVEVQAGTFQFDKPPCMLWNQRCGGYETNMNMTSGYARIDLRFTQDSDWDFGFFTYTTGRYSIKAVASSNEACVIQNQANSPSLCGPTARYKTSGEVAGIGASFRYFFTNWSVRPFLEVGVTYNRQTFTLDVVDQENGGGDYHFHDVKHGIGTVAGAGLMGKRMFAVLYLYESGADAKFDDGGYPAGVAGGLALGLGYKF